MSERRARDPHLFFDVTQLVHWPGKLTGIPRVMHELAMRFTNQPGVTFVAWVKEIEQFCEIDFEATMTQRGQGIVYKKHDDQVSPADDKSAMISSPRQTIAAKNYGIRIAKALLRRGARFNQKLATRLQDRLILLRVSQYKVAQPIAGDQLFIPWGEWWDERFSNHLMTLHANDIKLIQIIHDIATITCPQFFEQVAVSPADYNSKILPIAELVLVVSENTKRELTTWLKENNLHVPRIRVFRNGEDLRVNKPIKPTTARFEQAHLKGNDFLLSTGTIELKKNHQLYYYAYKLARSRGISLPPLVVVGRKGWMGETAINLMTKDPEVKDQFIVLLDTSDEELSWLYDHCLFTMLASFHEGWGIPIAESLARGVPCLCSNTSSMIEIAEGFVEHFSPASSDELLAGIMSLLDPGKLKASRDKAKQYRQFSWDDSFKQVLTYIKEIA